MSILIKKACKSSIQDPTNLHGMLRTIMMPTFQMSHRQIFRKQCCLPDEWYCIHFLISNCVQMQTLCTVLGNVMLSPFVFSNLISPRTVSSILCWFVWWMKAKEETVWIFVKNKIKFSEIKPPWWYYVISPNSKSNYHATKVPLCNVVS